MSKFFDETMQGLLEAVAIDKGEIPIEVKENMPAPTFVASDKEKDLIDELVNLRKAQNILLQQLVKMVKLCRLVKIAEK